MGGMRNPTGRNQQEFFGKLGAIHAIRPPEGPAQERARTALFACTSASIRIRADKAVQAHLIRNHRTAAVSEGPAAARLSAQRRRNDPNMHAPAEPLRLVLRTTAAFRFVALLGGGDSGVADCTRLSARLFGWFLNPPWGGSQLKFLWCPHFGLRSIMRSSTALFARR